MVALEIFINCFTFVLVIVLPGWLNYFNTDFYAKRWKTIPASPPPWLFAPVWTIMYLLLATSNVYLIIYAPAPLSIYWMATFSLFILNIVINHHWSITFFKRRAFGAALIEIVLILMSAIATAILLPIGGWWTSFWFYLAYPIWLAYATILNALWYVNYKSMPKKN